MAVRIRMKKFGRKHRPFFRICAFDSRSQRDGRALEELGTYDPMVPDVDARVVLDHDRVSHWLSVGALPSEKVSVLIKKYGPGGTRVAENEAARQRLATERTAVAPPEPAPAPAPRKKAKPATAETAEPEAAAAEAAEPAATKEAPAEE